MFKHYGSITVVAVAVAGVGFSGLSWASSGSSVNLQQALGEDSQAPFVFPVEGVTAPADFASAHDFLIDTTAFIETPDGVRLQLTGPVANTDGSRAGLTKTGTGTLVLGGQNSYGGNTRVTAGTLRLEGDSAAGSALRSVELFSGSTLEYAPDANVNNLLQLWHPDDAADDAVVPEGTVRLRVPEGRATQTGSIAAAPGAAVTLVKAGAGSLVLAGFAPASVGAEVHEGLLAVQAFLGGPVAVENGAVLAGTGTVGRLHVLPGGIVSPGLDAVQASPAALSVAGNLTLDAGSQLRLNVWPDGTADKVQVLGIARLGGTLQALAAEGDWAPETRYTVVQAQGGLQDTAFEAASTNLAYLTPGLDYDATSAYLTLTRNDRPLDDVLDDPGDDSVGDVIDDVGHDPVEPPEDVVDVDTGPLPSVPEIEPPPVPVVIAPEPAPEPEPEPDTVPQPPAPEPPTPETVLYDTLVTLPEPEAADTLRELDGSWQASVLSRVLADRRYLRELSLQEWRRMPATLGAGARAWAASYGAQASRSARGDTHGDTRRLGGAALGVTWWLPQAHADAPRLSLGAVAGVEHSRQQREGAPADASVRSLQVGLGASLQWKVLELTVGAIRSWHRLGMSRLMRRGEVPEWLDDARRAVSRQLYAELRVRLKDSAQWQADAFGRMAWLHTRMAAGEETGGLAALRFQEGSQQARLLELGVRLRRVWDTVRGRLALSGEAAWQGAGGNLAPENRARFRDSAGERHFTSRGQPLPRHAMNLRLTGQWQVSDRLALNLQYMGQLADGQRDHGARFSMNWRF